MECEVYSAALIMVYLLCISDVVSVTLKTAQEVHVQYSGTPLMQTLLGPSQSVLIRGVSLLISGVVLYT